MNLTFKQYRTIDLIIFAVILCVFEAITEFAANSWFAIRPFNITLVPLIVALVMIRWSGFALIHAVLGGIVTAICLKVTGGAVFWQQLLIYSVGNSFALLALIPLKIFTKKTVCKDFFNTALFMLLVFVLIILGRWAVAVMLGESIKIIANFFAYEIVTLLFSVIVICLLRRRDGMVEDQKAYLFRQEKEKAEGINQPEKKKHKDII